MAEHAQSSNRFIVVGSLNIDYCEDEDKATGTHVLTGKPLIGGKAANYAYQLSRLGASPIVFGRVGRDEHGDMIQRALSDLPRCVAEFVRSSDRRGTGVTVYSCSPVVRYWHIPGANADEELAIEISRDRNHWTDDPLACLCELECGPAEPDKHIFNVRNAFYNRRSGSTTMNVLDASFPAFSLSADIFNKTDVLIVRPHDVHSLFKDDKDAADMCSKLLNNRDYAHDIAVTLLKSYPGLGCVVFGYGFDGCAYTKCVGQRFHATRLPGYIEGPYPNSAHAAFAATLTYYLAKSWRRWLSDNPKSTFRRYLEGTADLDQCCQYGNIAYSLAASEPGASESMPTLSGIEQHADLFHRATRTMMSIDIYLSTKLQMDQATAEWRRFKAQVQSIVVPIVEVHGGRHSWSGDGFWTVFDSATNAVYAGLKVRDAMQDSHIEVRIGINSGDVVVGPDGFAQGLPASLAKRVESGAKLNRVTLSATTRALLNPRDFEFGDSSEIHPDASHPGEQPIAVCEVVRRIERHTYQD
jgi:sugar/nucleoside kinase (ribokinase family)